MQSVRLYFKETAIRDDGEFLCLTDMWRAAGGDKSRRPAKWLETEAAREFADYLRNDIRHTGIIRSERGTAGQRGGGATWAHWQLGLAYAKYLSPEFHAWCNDVVRAVMQGRAASSQLDVAALVTESLKGLLPSLLEQAAQHTREIISEHSYGYAQRVQVCELKAKRTRLAKEAVACNRFKSLASARKSYDNRIMGACGWSGPGASYDRLPAALLPYAMKEIAAIEKELGHGAVVRQLSLLPSG